jgi:hypothetical protein
MRPGLWRSGQRRTRVDAARQRHQHGRRQRGYRFSGARPAPGLTSITASAAPSRTGRCIWRTVRPAAWILSRWVRIRSMSHRYGGHSHDKTSVRSDAIEPELSTDSADSHRSDNGSGPYLGGRALSHIRLFRAPKARPSINSPAAAGPKESAGKRPEQHGRHTGPRHLSLMNLRKSVKSVARSKPSSVSSASSQPACGPEKRVMLCNYAHLQARQSSSKLRMPPIRQTFLVHNMFVDRGSMTRAVDNDNFILFDNPLRKQFI